MVIFPQHSSNATKWSARQPEHYSHRFLAETASLLFRALGLLLLFHVYCSAADPATDRTPIQAELVKSLEAGKIQVGDAVYAKVDLAWHNSACKLREGAILKGRIVTQTPRTKTVRSSAIALRFDSGQCGGRDMKPLPLTVAAVLAPDPVSGSSLFGNRENQPLNEAIGLSLNGGMRSMQGAAETAILEPPRPKPPQTVMPGQVIGIGDMKIAVGRGPEGSSVLTAEKHNLRLESGSRLVLVPNVETTAAPAPAEPARGAATPPPNPPGDTESLDESEVCVPPACSVELGASQAEISLKTA